MKKILAFITVAFFVTVSFLWVGKVGAVSDLDQYQTDGTGGNGIESHRFVGQSYKPTKNRLNKISLKLKGAGDLVYIQMTKTGENTLLLPGNPVVQTTNDADYKWYDISFDEVAVNVGDSYTIWVATFGNSFWAIHTGADELYANGMAYLDCSTWVSNTSCDHWISTADWTFKTYGYNTAEPAPATPPATPPVSGPLGSNSAPKATVTPEAALNPPVLTSLKKGGVVVELPVKDTVIITEKGELSLSGTSVENGEVTIVIGEKSYPATMEKNGNWKISLLGSALKAGEYTVKGKTIKAGKTSTETELFKLKIENLNDVKADTEQKGWFKDVYLYYLAALAVILAGAIAGMVVHAVNHRKSLKKAKQQ